MTFDEVWETLPGNGWLTREEAELLWKAARETTGPILEIGSYYGRSTVLLARARPECPVYAVDPFQGFDSDDPTGENVRAAFLDNMRERGICNVWQFWMRVEDWHPTPVGLAYLDGDHTGPGTERQILKALACDPKIIAVHDVADSGDGLIIQRAALALLGPWRELVGRLAVWELR